jgi:uncharacterized integral membrane protein
VSNESGGAPSNQAAGTPVTADQVRRFGPPALIGLAALLFIFQNTNEVRFNFLFIDFEWPLWIMLLVFAAVGAVVFWAVSRRIQARKAAK